MKLRQSPLPRRELSDVALSFTYLSRVFLIETRMKSEIQFEAEKGLGYVAAEDRASLRDECETRVDEIRNGKRSALPLF